MSTLNYEAAFEAGILEEMQEEEALRRQRYNNLAHPSPNDPDHEEDDDKGATDEHE